LLARKISAFHELFELDLLKLNHAAGRQLFEQRIALKLECALYFSQQVLLFLIQFHISGGDAVGDFKGLNTVGFLGQ
jgi:hypothetical protein